MNDNGNVTALPTVEQDKNIAQLETLKRNLDTIIETNKVIARIRRESFLAYVAQGFTTEQALELCK